MSAKRVRIPVYPYDDLTSLPGKVYHMPRMRPELIREYWPVRYAAKKWGCSYRAARLWMLRHPEHCVMVLIQSATADRYRWILTVRAGTVKAPAMRGNPAMMDPEWQRRMKKLYWIMQRRRAARER